MARNSDWNLLTLWSFPFARDVILIGREGWREGETGSRGEKGGRNRVLKDLVSYAMLRLHVEVLASFHSLHRLSRWEP